MNARSATSRELPAPATDVVWTTRTDDVPAAVAVGGHGAQTLVAVAGAGGLLGLLDRDGREVATASVEDGLLTAAWSADGMTLAVGSTFGAWTWTRDGGLRRLGTTGWCGALSWHGADRLAVGAGRRAVILETTRQGLQPAWSTPSAASTVTTLTWLRQGRELAVGAYGGARAFTRGRAAPARDLPYAGSLLAADASPDGRWLVSGNQDASIHVWRLRDGEELEMAGFPRKVTVVSFDASGRWLAANGARDSTVWDFGGRGPGGTAPRMLTHDPDGARTLVWHPRHPVVASGGAEGAVAVWSVPDLPVGRPQAPRWSCVVDGSPVTALAWLDGSVLVAATRETGVTALAVPDGPA